MRIDFHTQYSPEHYKSLCKKAISLGLDGLVMTGLPDNYDRKYKSLRIFPAQEVDWKAALEVPSYERLEDLKAGKKPDSEPTNLYYGKALALLPSNQPFMSCYDKRLYQLFAQVKDLGGITIALQDDTNSSITNVYDGGYLYPFDAVRIRPHSSHDINSELVFSGNHFLRSAVAGSGAYKPEELLTPNSAFTIYETPIKSKDELISAIKKRIPNKLRVFETRKFPFLRPHELDIQETVPPLEIVINPKIISEFIRELNLK